MKNIFSICGLLVAQVFFSQSNGISVSYGVVSNDQLISSFSSVLGNALVGNSVKNIKSNGSISFSYHRSLKNNQRFAYGISAVYDNLKADVVDNNGTKQNTQKTTALTVALEGRYQYTKGKLLNLYGLLGAGYTFSRVKYSPSLNIDSNEENNHFNFQFTPVGLQYGRALKGFVELGVGYKGIAAAGIQYDF